MIEIIGGKYINEQRTMDSILVNKESAWYVYIIPCPSFSIPSLIAR
jgi:hypothetical protein